MGYRERERGGGGRGKYGKRKDSLKEREGGRERKK